MTTLRFHGSAAVLLLPLALFVAVTARLFISEAAFDLTGLAAAGVLTLFSGSLLAKAPSEYWKAAVRGASSELTGTVVLILIASGIFSAMMKASGVADGLVFLGGMLHLTGHAFTVFVLLASSLMAAATGSSIGTLLAAMPIFFPAGVALGADPTMLAGAVLSGAIFGDNLAPVSDVTIISSVTQRFRNGTPADIAGVVRTRLPYALIALAVSLPVYAFMGESLPVSEAALSGDASALLMLVPVAVLIAIAVRTRDVLMAISAGAVTGTATGLLIGRLSFATIFAADDGRLSGFLISGISNVSPIILLCVTLFAFTGIVREAGVPDMMAKALEAGSAGRPSALRTELFLSAATLVVTTLFAAVTSASVALVGSLTGDIGRASNVPLAHPLGPSEQPSRPDAVLGLRAHHDGRRLGTRGRGCRHALHAHDRRLLPDRALPRLRLHGAHGHGPHDGNARTRSCRGQDCNRPLNNARHSGLTNRKQTMTSDDTFELYDLEVTVEGDEKDFVCRHHAGHAFRVEGEDLVFPEGGRFSMYALAALIPLLPAKERPTSPNDWMTTDALIACPDPNCGAKFRIRRTAKRILSHAECTVVPLGEKA